MKNSLIPTPEAASLIKQAEILNANLDRLHNIINMAGKSVCGLTLESDKTPEWRNAKHEYDIQFCRLREINSKLNKLRRCIGYEAIDGKRIAIYKY